MDTKTQQALDFYKNGDLKKSLSIFKTFKMGFTKDEKNTLSTAYEILTGKESFYKQLGIDTVKELKIAKDILNKKYSLSEMDIDLEKGDTILTGKFKNKKVVVKDFGKDEKGQPTVNGKSALKFRVQKLMPAKEGQMKTREEKIKEAKEIKLQLEKLTGSKVTLKEIQKIKFDELPKSILKEINSLGFNIVKGTAADMGNHYQVGLKINNGFLKFTKSYMQKIIALPKLMGIYIDFKRTEQIVLEFEK